MSLSAAGARHASTQCAGRAAAAPAIAAAEGFDRNEPLVGRIARLAERFGQAADTGRVFSVLREFVSESVPCNGMFVSLLDAGTQLRHCVYAWSEGVEEDVSGLPPLPLNDSPNSRAVLTGEVIITDDYARATAGLPHIDMGLEVDPRLPQSSLVVPMAMLGRVIGAMEIQSVERGAYRPGHVTALRMAAPLAAMAIENARLLRRERGLRLEAEESERRKAAVFESALDAVITIDAAGRVLEFNAAATRMFGHSREAAIGRDLASMVIPQRMREAHRRALQALARGAPHSLSRRLEVEAMRADGSEFPAELSISRVGDSAPVIFTGFIRDLTGRKRAEAEQAALQAQLRESQKVEAIGRLARGIAHDFNNIIGAILGNLDLARELTDGPEVIECLEEIRKAGDRGRGLVRQILSYSRHEATERFPLCLADVAQASISMLRASIPPCIEVRLERGDAAPVLGDASQIGQVVLNLVTNSVHALGGTPGVIEIRVERAGAGATRLVVADSGHGMDAATRERIFDPFFTTKPAGEGTGLGLSVVHGIVASHGGTIEVRSEPGAGCSFFITLPAAQLPPDPPAVSCESLHVTGHEVSLSE